MVEKEAEKEQAANSDSEDSVYYRIRFRKDSQEFFACSSLNGLTPNEVVMVKTDHGLEPAEIICAVPGCSPGDLPGKVELVVVRRSTHEERTRFENLAAREERAKRTCLDLVDKHKLSMKLIRVERFFDGSKMIFYFTAENRVDFRELVKDLVREFRTRVEMRQVGVRHETKMIGGLGACGRELCCSSFINTFDSVSIKMAKEQDLPLNPSRISGVCNRLLCCLTYEHETYRKHRKGMPKCGRKISINDEELQVIRQIPLSGEIIVSTPDGGHRTLTRDQWKSFKPLKPIKQKRKNKKNR